MKRLILLLAASALTASPAMAQHAGHDMPGMKMPAPAKTPTAKTPSPKKATAKKPASKKPSSKKAPPAKKPTAKKPPAEPAADPHAGHDMSGTPRMDMPKAQADPHEGHDMPVTDPHAGHVMPNEPSGEHAGHDMSATAVDVPVGPPPPEALQGPENAADTAWGKDAMADGRAVLFNEHGKMLMSKILVDQLETRFRSGRDGYFLNAEGWYGGDIDKLWLKTEIEGAYGSKPEQAEFQALWSHAVDPWFDVQTGVRFDAQPDTRGRLVVGVQGLLPYWIELDSAAFLSDKGDVTARAEAEHDVRITQNLILQPRAEVDLSLQDIPQERVGSGLSKAEVGLRLRYQVTPNLAPYAGLSYEHAFGDTRRFLRADGEDPSSLSFVVGLRTWF
ncbi:copper resistance protein B [Sphingomonas daechungensis]|uniref:copper resistance protein B n=1 Tax=Sphingomonas daechungensis TaxID=1176646 RepID=UPI0037843275